MRWERLFTDLESHFQGLEKIRREGEIIDLRQAEAVEISMWDRLRGLHEHQIEVGLCNELVLREMLLDSGPDWILLGRAQIRWLIPQRAILWVAPITRVAVRAETCQRLSLNSALRGLAEVRANLQLILEGGEMTGTIRQVAKDHLLIGVGSPRTDCLVPLSRLVALRTA